MPRNAAPTSQWEERNTVAKPRRLMRLIDGGTVDAALAGYTVLSADATAADAVVVLVEDADGSVTGHTGMAYPTADPGAETQNRLIEIDGGYTYGVR